MRRKKKCLSIIASILLTMVISSCNGNSQTTSTQSIVEPPVAMKQVTQENVDKDMTFHMQIPEDWNTFLSDAGIILIYPESKAAEEYALKLVPHDFSGMVTSDKDEKIFKDLFLENTISYEESIKKTFAQQIDMQEKLKNAETFLDYLEIMSPDPDISYKDYDIPELHFQYTEYIGQQGKCIKAQYTYSEENNTSSTKYEYFRENFPYFICATKNEIEGLSTDQIALWALQTLTL